MTQSVAQSAPDAGWLVALPQHPAAQLFPMMSEKDLEALAADIRLRGLRNPIVLFDENGERLMLDGRNRALACRMAGVEPRWTVWSGTDPVAYVVSENLERRHLSESQRGMVAARLATLRLGDNRDASRGKGASIDAPLSQVEAAKRLNVSRPTVQRARKVMKAGVPDLVRAVDDGAVTLNAALEVAALPPREQVEALDAMRAAPSRAEAAAQRRRVVRALHDQGKGTAEIARTLGVEDQTLISNDKKVLGISKNEPSIRLWRDIERLATVLDGTTLQSDKLADQLSNETPNASNEEIDSCVKKLSAVTASINRLRSALRNRRQ